VGVGPGAKTAVASARAEFLRYLVAGLLNTALGYAVFLALHLGLGLDARPANAMAFAVALLQSLLLNRWFVFRGARLGLGAAWRFGVGFALAYGLNFLVLHLLLRQGMPAALAQLVAMAAYTVSFYGLNRVWVWRPARASVTGQPPPA